MPNDPLIGRMLANFHIERLLGQGGMAHVYYGHDVKLDRPVAIKIVHPRYRDNPVANQRFVREARAVAAWRHEHIIQIYYADDLDGLSYFVMEYIDGQDLGAVLAEQAQSGTRMSYPEVLRIGRAIAAALDYAHTKGVVHRDVKPSNVFISSDGRVVLGDFGLAMDLQEGTLGEVFGTPHYISPEQAHRSSNAVPQSDLYSLGIILYEMLTGVVPFDDPSPTSVAVQHVTKAPPPPRSLNPALSLAAENVLLKALSKAPADRYQSGAALIQALEETLSAPPPLADEASVTQTSALPLVEQRRQPSAHEPDTTALPLAAPERQPDAYVSEDQPAAAALPAQRAVSTKTLALGGALMAALLLIVALLGIFRDTQVQGTATAQPSATPQGVAGAPAATVVQQQGSQEPTAADAVEPTAAGVVEPTAPAQPQGTRRLMLHYDETTIYLVNLSGDTIGDIGGVAFERLGDDGQVLERFEAAQWPYRTIRDGQCSRLQVIGTTRMQRPAECAREASSLERNANRGIVFWNAQAGSSAFRVTWQGTEVGRCATGTGSCEVFLP